MKTLIKNALATIIGCFTLLGCNTKTSQEVFLERPNAPIGDTSENSLDWNGTYKGLIPCADCEGIAITLTIKSDRTFEKFSTYLGKTADRFIEQGSFVWDESGKYITLIGDGGDKQSFQVGENILFILDQDGNRILGNMEELYILKKNLADYSLENKKWVLTTLQGNKYPNASEEKEIFLYFDNETSRFYGNTGCNSINGVFSILEDGKISIENIASTMMACPYMKSQEILTEVLKEVDNYSVVDNQLFLTKAKMAPLAKFITVE